MSDNTERTDLSPATRRCLEQAGWLPGRRIDISLYEVYERGLRAEGYSLSDAARSFLEEFGGLTVVFPFVDIPGETERFHLNPLRGAGSVTRERVETYEERVGESLVVIGEAYSEHMVLTMSESGKVYGGYDDILVRFGNSGREALETLCEGIKANEVYIPREDGRLF